MLLAAPRAQAPIRSTVPGRVHALVLHADIAVEAPDASASHLDVAPHTAVMSRRVVGRGHPIGEMTAGKRCVVLAQKAYA